jgi:hypothetical protein
VSKLAIEDRPTYEQIQDASERCLKEIQLLKLSEETHRNLVLICVMDALNWVLGEEDEKNVGIKSWEELGLQRGR